MTRFTKQINRENKAKDGIYKEYKKDPNTIKNQGLISTNSKTGYSFNMPMLTCSHSTSVCEKHCYACAGHFLHRSTVEANVRRLIKIEMIPINDLVLEMAKAIKWGIKHFRWNGSGDFTEKTLIILNRLAKIRDDIQFYAYSRNPYLSSLLSRSVSLNFSIDRESVYKLGELNHPKVIVNYLQEEDNEVIPDGVGLIHPVHNNLNKSSNFKITCPYATSKGKIKCDQCKICITPKPSRTTNFASNKKLN